MNDNITRLYAHRTGNIGLSTKAIELLELDIMHEAFVGTYYDKMAEELYLYGAVPTCEKSSTKQVTKPKTGTPYFTIQQNILDVFFQNIEGTYAPLALEEEPYLIGSIEHYKVITIQEAKELL